MVHEITEHEKRILKMKRNAKKRLEYLSNRKNELSDKAFDRTLDVYGIKAIIKRRLYTKKEASELDKIERERRKLLDVL